MLSIKDCGLMLEPQMGMKMQQIVDAARMAEDLDFGYLFRSDHLLPTDDRRGIDSPECWTSLGVLASASKTLKFGPMVSPIGFRNPALLAKMACTLHSFSGGRLQLAVGAGWYEPEYRAHGFEFPSFSVRKKQFEEALTVIMAMLRDGRVDFKGQYFSAHTDCLPRPAGRVHLIIGGKAKSVVTIAGKQADEWNFFAASVDQFREMKAVLGKAAAGRKVIVSMMGPFLIGEKESDVMASAKWQLEKFGRKDSPESLLKRLRSLGAPCGTVDEFTDQLSKLVDAGIERFYFQALVPENREMIELLAETIKKRL